jgi:ATP-dependent HslUV protease ATP-binding subunit HslU
MYYLTPQEIVGELDKNIVGQHAAKRAVAIALRNRWRRSQIEDDLGREITPKNIIMVGPTGVGKTEIARRLAQLVSAPFIKVEATKFTEVGYVGRDVDSIIRDLTDVAIRQERQAAVALVQDRACAAAVERLLDIVLADEWLQNADQSGALSQHPSGLPTGSADDARRAIRRQQLLSGQLDSQHLEINIPTRGGAHAMDYAGGMGDAEDMSDQLRDVLSQIQGGRKKNRNMTVKKALKLVTDEEASKLINDYEIKRRALINVEQNGIVFIDEIDKIITRLEGNSATGSRQGVQHDLLPLVEGTSIATRHGSVNTDHILFIASGAFHVSKPSDLIPELQGRFPIRVELLSLTVRDFEAILTSTNASLTKQYTALLAVENVKLVFKPCALAKMAQSAFDWNERHENIGARRLATVMEWLLEDISFDASKLAGQTVTVDAAYVVSKLARHTKDEDFSHSIL